MQTVVPAAMTDFRAVADELRAAVIESQVAVADPVAGVQTAPAVAAGL